ncbi:MAG TPA: cytochrome c [Sphingobium sp.]|uniref:cytochrome c n=1 Tax=Sphingobium sp. TaxID=1912891 RepID=UPI002ED2335C
MKKAERFSGIVGSLLVLTLLSGSGVSVYGQAPSTSPDVDGAVLDRQLIMQQLDRDATALGQILAGIGDADTLADHAHAIARGAKEAVAAYRTVSPGGAAKAEVWSDHENFMRHMQDFADKAQAMADASDTHDIEKVSSLAVEALPCKSCHDRYKGTK